MSDFSDFFPAAGGGGGSMPIIQEFTSSGTFTPTQALIDAGGRLSFILVGAGGKSSDTTSGGSGGFVMLGYQTLTSTTGCTVTIAAGTTTPAVGGPSSVLFSSAGGTDETAAGGIRYTSPDTTEGPWGPNWGNSNTTGTASGNGIMNMGVGASQQNNVTGAFYYNPTYKNYGSGACGPSGSRPSGPGFLRIIYFE
tara:strand:- start:41 stop:625 length:585 start_codon:yes stop_codon:yes gene_type:complete